MTHRVALLTRIVNADSSALARLADAGVEVVADLARYDELMRTDDGRRQWSEMLENLDGLVVGLQPVAAALLDAAPRLRYVLRIGTGMDTIDVAACRARGVEATALPGMNAGAVAEFAFALLLAAAKRLPEIEARIRDGRWERVVGKQVEGSTLGLVGFGPIAQAMVAKAHGFGMDIVVYRRSVRPGDEERYGVRFVDLAELLRISDFVSLHLPLTAETKHLISEPQIDLMDDTVLINTGRGDLVDEQALLRGLREGKVRAAALDVLADEPSLDSELVGLPQVLITSHTAGQTDQVNARIAATAAAFIIERIADRNNDHVHDSTNPEASHR